MTSKRDSRPQKWSTRWKRRATSTIGPDFKSDFNAAKKLQLNWRAGLVLSVVTFALAAFLDKWGMLDYTMPVMISMFSLCLVTVVKWQIRQAVWFQITMAIFTVLQIPLIWIVSWPTGYGNASVFAGFGSIDAIAMLAILSFIHRHFKVADIAKSKNPESA